MIDLEWLKTLQFESSSGRVTGLAGIGAQWIVFHVIATEENATLGKEIVLKIPNTPSLGFHIREIPPDLELAPTYDAARVNRKLRAQVGNALFDSMVEAYNDLYEYLIAVLYRGGLDAFRTLAAGDQELEDFFAFFLKTPGVTRRLEDAAVLDATGDPREIVSWNGLVNAIDQPRGELATWARAALATVRDHVREPSGSEPERLNDNPFWIWGGAVLDGFFTSEEMPASARFMAASFGNPGDGPDAGLLRFQMFSCLSLLSLVAKHKDLQRLAEFCGHAGFRWVLPDPEPAPEQAPQQSPDGQLPTRMPMLSPPWVVPAFPEEGHVDPLAQDPQLLAAAAARVSTFAGRLTEAAHLAGVAITLPQPDAESDAHWKPWRTVVQVVDGVTATAAANEEPAELSLTQRLLAAAQAVAARAGDAVPEEMAEALEDIGSVALGRSVDVLQRPMLNACRAIGDVAARLHRLGFVHGDLQPRNFTFEEDGKIASMFDLGKTGNSGRPLTVLERASDLAVLKKHVSFLEWEAAQLGYRSGAPDAEDVLAEFKQRR